MPKNAYNRWATWCAERAKREQDPAQKKQWLEDADHWREVAARGGERRMRVSEPPTALSDDSCDGTMQGDQHSPSEALCCAGKMPSDKKMK
jgi:hypothetical protein